MDSNADSNQSVNTAPARILLADGEPITLLGLSTLLAQHADFVVVDSLNSADGLVEAVKRHRPDILLMDLRLKGGGGLPVIEELFAIEGLPTRLAILTTALSDAETCELIKYGVSGLLLKDIPLELIVQCLRRVHAGGQWLERQSIALALEGMLKREAEFQVLERQLSKRELELALLIARGASNKAASKTLSLSEGSVRVYLNRIYEKLHVSSRMELSIAFRDKGLV